MEPLILFTSKNMASKTISEFISYKKTENPVDSILEITKGINTKNKYVIVLSSHKSKSMFKCLTVHVPGNYSDNKFGGEKETLNIAYCSMMRSILGNMKRLNKKYGIKYNITYEVDHHGPTIKDPIMFVEIGSGPKEWANKTAGKIIAESIEKAIDEKETYPCYFGVGGGHYASRLTRFALSKDFALGHILPNYQINGLKEHVFTQAIEKNVEKLEGVIIDKKKIVQKEKILKLCNKYGIEVKEI